MVRVHFFTPVTFDSPSKSKQEDFIEKVDGYFYLGGKRAYVISTDRKGDLERKARLLKDKSPCYITALKILSYFTIVIPFVMLIAKAILRCGYSIQLISKKTSSGLMKISLTDEMLLAARKHLESGMKISQNTRAKLTELMPTIRGGGAKKLTHDEITWHNGLNRVFSLKSLPGVIFKISRENDLVSPIEKTRRRFEKMIEVQAICLQRKFDQVIIPHATMFQIDDVHIIAEELIVVTPYEGIQEELYKRVNLEAIEAFASLIIEAKLEDVNYRNFPPVQLKDGRIGIALLDLEHLGNELDSIFGLMGFLSMLQSEEQIDTVLKVARRYRLQSSESSPGFFKEMRMKEIQSDEQLQAFYKEKRIDEDPRQPIKVDFEKLKSLGLDYKEQGFLTVQALDPNNREKIILVQEPIQLGRVVADVFRIINNSITKAPEGESIKAIRQIHLNTLSKPLNDYKHLGLTNPFSSKEIKGERKWLDRIIDTFIQLGILFKVSSPDTGNGYIIQA